MKIKELGTRIAHSDSNHVMCTLKIERTPRFVARRKRAVDGHNENGKAKKCKQTTQRLQVASDPLRLNRFITESLMAAHGRF